ncbi:ATP synthase subunit e, mitochondrial-like [Adelges cooleyi]|uniref:ATP synthase subunit e, mitochondrial-like n=1 Tax=Adelges cooleyi TaxID=133065 RepID=UPI00217F4583|nr:ATP synthase subunit e, mitochondrial-like [Adelges cooleyi]
MVRDFKAAVNVSPLIRFGRYSMLILGIGYGVTRHSFLQRSEDKTREERYKKKAERDAKLALEKKKYAEEEMKGLEAIMNPVKES